MMDIVDYQTLGVNKNSYFRLPYVNTFANIAKNLNVTKLSPTKNHT